MKSLRARRHRSGAADTPADGPSTWNTLGTLGAGSIAAVDPRGVIFPFARPVSIECWFGVGDRWFRGGAGDGVRQRRIDGLPILETRQRAGDDDLVATVWADESGDARGRVVVELANETADAVIVAVVVRPHGLHGPGSIEHVRIAETLVVVDRTPLIDLGRLPGDVVTAEDADRFNPALHTVLGLDRSALQRDLDMASAKGFASLAALLPLTPGVDRRIEIFDGAEAASVAAAPLDNVVSGWNVHLSSAAEFELPRWPSHVPSSLITGVVTAVPDRHGPSGDSEWTEADDALLSTALSGVGIDWGAAEILDRLLDAVISGRIERKNWVAVACAVAAGVESPAALEVYANHGEALAVVAGEALSRVANESLAARLATALEIVHGADAAADARAIHARPDAGASLLALRHGFGSVGLEVTDSSLAELDAESRALGISTKMLMSVHGGASFEPIVAIRSAAGSTWRWGRGRCGDSPHARAALLIALRGLCVAESSATLDLLPGADTTWLGQSASFSRLPTAHGALSCALRWHGARAALLWEFEHSVPDDLVITCTALDPSWRGSGSAGEVLLAEPTHLLDGAT